MSEKENRIIINGDVNPTNNMHPRSINAEYQAEIDLDRTGNTFSGNTRTGNNGNSNISDMLGTAGMNSGSPNIVRNPSRRYYDPEVTTTAIYLPKDLKTKNRWNRWYFAHDELIGTVLEMHAELPYSRASLMLDDHVIKREFEDCLEDIKFFSELPRIDLEYLKTGEVFINTPWDKTKGRWSHIICQNPDFVDVRFSPFADEEAIIEIIPDDELKKIVHSTKPEDQAIKKRIPADILKRVLSGRNIILNSDEVTHIARKLNPYDTRGTSIISRLYRCFVPETGVRMYDGTIKEIKDVVKGDYVLSLNGEKREVLDTVQYNINDKIVHITPEKSSDVLKCTQGHEFLIQKSYCACGCGQELTYRQIKNNSVFMHGHNLKFNSSLVKDGKDNLEQQPITKVEKCESQNIKVGDRLLVPINNEIGECNISEGQARMLGYFMAEGCFINEESKQPGINFTFGLHEQDTWAADVVSTLENEFDIHPNTYPGHHEKNVFTIKIVRRADYEKLAAFFNDNMIGRRSWTKEYTEKVLYYPKNIQKQILFGSFRGDASRNTNFTEAYLNTTSKIMAEQTQWMLFRCQYHNYINYVDMKPTTIDKRYTESIRRRLYRVRTTGNYAKQFIKECWGEYLEIVPTNVPLYKKIKKWYDSGHSFTKIANELNAKGIKGIEGGAFYNNTVKNILINKGSVGKQYQFKRDSITHDENYFYVPVKKTELMKYKGIVHDITVKTHHWWLGTGSYVTSNTLMYEDKLRESQITISDNFIYPLKVFKLGDQNRGWIPNESHQRALAGMLQQASFDPNFSLIYHYGLQIEYHTVADKLMRLDQEWSEINSRKLIALGVSEQFIKGDSSFSCFVEGTLVNTPKGFAPIESIKNNDIVLDKEGIPQVVTNNWDEGIPKKLVKINLWGGKSFECTETHKWPVWSWPRTCLCGCGKTVRPGKSYAHKGAQLEASKKNIKFLDCGRHTLSGKMLMPVHGDYEPINTYEAKDIQHQDYLMIPRKFKEIKPNVTLDHARLLGYWVAEGNFSKNSRTKEKAGLNLTFNINEEHTWYKDSTEILEAIGIPLTKTEYRNSSIRIRTSNLIDHRDKIKWFFDNGGEYSYGKTLSPEVMSWPLEYKMEFIKGLFRGDGTHSSKSIKGGSHQHLVSYVTVSKTLAEQVELILAQLGFPCNWTLVDQSKTKSKGNRMCYRLTIYGKFCFELAKLVWGDACKIKESTFRGQKAFVDDNYVYLMVRSTELLDNTENKKVFNLTVDGTHSYLVHSVGTFNSASVGLQTLLSRYKAKRDLFEIRWVRDKLFRVMAERNEWYYRDKREIANNFRVTRSSSELKDRLMIPKLVWEKKLMLRDDQAHLTFLSNVFAQGKGPISAETLLQSMGLDIEEELRKKKAQKQLEQKVGEYVMPPAPGAPGAGGAPGGAPGGLPGLSPPSPSSAGGAPVGAAVAGSSTAPMAPGAKAFIDKAKELFRFGKKEVEVKTAQNDYLNKIIASTLELPNDPFATPISDVSDEASLNNTRAGSILVGDTSATKYANKDVFISKEHSAELEFIRRIPIVPDDLWYKNITASVVPGEVGILMSLLDSKLKSYTKKYADFSQVTDSDFDSVSKLYEDIYLQGKILTYSKLGSIPVQYQIQSTVNADIRDYSDIIIFNNFKEWIDTYKNIDIPSKNKLSYLRSLGNSCFAIGQIKGFQEQGINNVRIGNVLAKEGLHFKADDLMDKGVYLSPYLTYTDEVILLNPCIEGYDYEESGNFVDDSIQRYKTFSENGLIIKDCPIEFTGYISSILNKTGSLFKSKYSTIQFVLDVVDTQEWKDQYLAIIEKEIQDPILSMQKLSLDLNYKRGKIATFIDGKTLFVSSWIGMEDAPFTDNFIKHSGIFDESIVKKVSKAFKVPSYDLSKDEMETYTMFNYLDPIVDDLKEVRGYKASSTYIAIPQKLRYGKTWSADGKCVNSMKESVYDVFSKNIRLYIDYPQFLDEDIIKSYNEVF